MKIVFLSILLVLLASVNSISQAQLSEFEKSNVLWLKELKNKSVDEQILEIRARLASDTSQTNNSKTFISTSKYDPACQVMIVIDNIITKINYNRSLILLNELRPSIIKNIYVLDEVQGPPLYGSDARCGVIVLNSKHKKLTKKF
jgi:hypothetical protein